MTKKEFLYMIEEYFDMLRENFWVHLSIWMEASDQFNLIFFTTNQSYHRLCGFSLLKINKIKRTNQK